MNKQVETKSVLAVEKKGTPEQLVFSLGGQNEPVITVDVIRSNYSEDYRFEIRSSNGNGDVITVDSAFSKVSPLEKVVDNAIQSIGRIYSNEGATNERSKGNFIHTVANHLYYWSNINDFRNNAMNLALRWNNALSDVHPGNVIDTKSGLVVPCVSIRVINELAQVKLTSPCGQYRTIISVSPTVCSEMLDKHSGNCFGTISGKESGKYMLVISNDTFKNGKVAPNEYIRTAGSGMVTGTHLLQSMFQKKALDLVTEIAEVWFDNFGSSVTAPQSTEKLKSLISELKEYCS